MTSELPAFSFQHHRDLFQANIASSTKTTPSGNFLGTLHTCIIIIYYRHMIMLQYYRGFLLTGIPSATGSTGLWKGQA